MASLAVEITVDGPTSSVTGLSGLCDLSVHRDPGAVGTVWLEVEYVTSAYAAGTLTLSGVVGSIDSVSVENVTITSGSVPFNTDLTTTATDLAANITAHTSVPNYTATAAVGVVTITADDPGTAVNGYTVAAVASGGMGYTSTSLSGGAGGWYKYSGGWLGNNEEIDDTIEVGSLSNSYRFNASGVSGGTTNVYLGQ